ncbi:hypothetical protein FRX31_032803, partial [Thalictrum thalictroides]
MPAALTGGFLQMREGLRASGKGAVIGDCFLAMLEGGNIIINKLKAAGNQQQRVEEASSTGGGGYGENQLDKNLDVFLTHNPPLEHTTE